MDYYSERSSKNNEDSEYLESIGKDVDINTNLDSHLDDLDIQRVSRASTNSFKNNLGLCINTQRYNEDNEDNEDLNKNPLFIRIKKNLFCFLKTTIIASNISFCVFLLYFGSYLNNEIGFVKKVIKLKDEQIQNANTQLTNASRIKSNKEEEFKLKSTQYLLQAIIKIGQNKYEKSNIESIEFLNQENTLQVKLHSYDLVNLTKHLDFFASNSEFMKIDNIKVSKTEPDYLRNYREANQVKEETKYGNIGDRFITARENLYMSGVHKNNLSIYEGIITFNINKD